MEESEENRNCNTDCNNIDNNRKCQYMPQGINAAFGYNTVCDLYDDMKVNDDDCQNERNELRRKMLKEIKCLNFAIVELAEYLDTHPDDRKALCLHRAYTNELKEVKEKYQKIFGPLTIYYPCNKWRWLEEPWPWERSDFDVDL